MLEGPESWQSSLRKSGFHFTSAGSEGRVDFKVHPGNRSEGKSGDFEP